MDVYNTTAEICIHVFQNYTFKRKIDFDNGYKELMIIEKAIL